jgi:uncharacterized protein YnzC (UPF0291/DUF896 family)
MQDQSYLDLKYFIDATIYNCPFCNRRHVTYSLESVIQFDWTDKKACFVYVIKCKSCGNNSMHLSYDALHAQGYPYHFRSDIQDFDAHIFYSVPTSFFVLDDRIPSIIRELITEAEGCLKMNFLTGASACMRKAIYELTIIEKSTGNDYESKIKSLKDKYRDSDPALFDILAHIQNMTSDKIHEQSWDEWNSHYLQLIIETLKTVLHDIYVNPKVKADRSNFIQALLQKVSTDKKNK